MIFKLETKYTIDSFDFNDFLTSKYGGDFEFVAQEEANNGSSYKYTVDGKLDNIDDNDIEDVRNGDYGDVQVCDILDVLCADGHIEAGKYLISVSW